MADVIWICPLCQAPLVLSHKQWLCSSGHAYDQAKAGYVNLLLANQKSRPEPGDNKQMMQARRAFLEQDHYLPLVHALRDLFAQLPGKPPGELPGDSLTMHDAGCGEGYFPGRLVADLQQSGRSIRASGHDISRAAIELAAKRYGNLHFAVASSFAIPVASHSQHLVLQIFAPANAAEIHRILMPSGLWVRVTPAAQHLTELRQALYQTPQLHSEEHEVAAGFEPFDKTNGAKTSGDKNNVDQTSGDQTTVRFTFELPDRQSRMNLLMMTPYYWSVQEGAIDALLDNMAELTADFSIQVMRKLEIQQV